MFTMPVLHTQNPVIAYEVSFPIESSAYAYDAGFAYAKPSGGAPMSLRPVELQFALHKNDEVGLKQNQLNQKPQDDQLQLANAAMKQMDRERQVTGKADDVLHASVHDQEKDKSGGRKANTSGKKGSRPDDNSKESGRNDHPFKGKHIDLSL